MLKRSILVASIIGVLATSLLAADRIALHLSTPRFQNAPAYVRFSIRIPQDKANRQVCVAVDGDTGFYRQSCFEHVGEGARVETLIEYKDIPAGRYSIGAELIYVDEEGKKHTAHPAPQTFRVMGIGEMRDPEEN